jgi:hypothetical protein
VSAFAARYKSLRVVHAAHHRRRQRSEELKV